MKKDYHVTYKFLTFVNISSYIVQYPVLGTSQSALHFTPWQTYSIKCHLWNASSGVACMCKGCSYIYLPLSIAKYSFMQLSELEQCRVKKFAQGFKTAAQNLNPGSLSREV